MTLDADPAPGRLSIIVPVLNEAETIKRLVTSLAALSGERELIVVDGGSSDGTVALLRQLGVHVITAPAGRGSQMHAGAMAACGEVLWFLHADTSPPPDAIAHIAAALRDPRTVGGNFSIRFAGDSAAAFVLTWLYRYLSWIGLRYGDSAYFVRRSAYFAVGGFEPFPIFEDLDLLRRLRRAGRLARVEAVVVTSSRRFEGRLFAGVFASWTLLQVMYWLGVPPPMLGRLYRQVRRPGRWRWPRRRRAEAGAVTAATTT